MVEIAETFSKVHTLIIPTTDNASTWDIIDRKLTFPSISPNHQTDEPATLVYAELQLKPPAEHGYVSKPAESTEYAEILYVQNSEGKTGPVVVGEESGERPTASAVQPPATKPEPSAGDQKK